MPVGQKLEEARKRKGVSLREVSESTKIRGDYLSAIESGNVKINLPEVYLRGFVRLYAKFLDLDQDAMVAELDNDLGKSSSKLSKKSLGSIVAQDQNENSSKTFTQKSSSSPAKHSSASSKLLSLPVVLSLVGVVTTLIVVLLIYNITQGDGLQSQNDYNATISEVSNNLETGSTSEPQVSNNLHMLKISMIGNVEKLIICDEGKTPNIFHEFDSLTVGWQKDIPFENSFRLYASNIENVTFSVDGGELSKIGGDKKGIGTFNWKP